jgi:catalase
VQRSLLTARSVEFDAIVIAAAPPPGPDAVSSLDAKAGGPAAGDIDRRVMALVDEAYRHGKAIAAVGAGVQVAEAAGVADETGVLTTDDIGAVETLAEGLLSVMRGHRIWTR